MNSVTMTTASLHQVSVWPLLQDGVFICCNKTGLKGWSRPNQPGLDPPQLPSRNLWKHVCVLPNCLQPAAGLQHQPTFCQLLGDALLLLSNLLLLLLYPPLLSSDGLQVVCMRDSSASLLSGLKSIKNQLKQRCHVPRTGELTVASFSIDDADDQRWVSGGLRTQTHLSGTGKTQLLHRNQAH